MEDVGEGRTQASDNRTILEIYTRCSASRRTDSIFLKVSRAGNPAAVFVTDVRSICKGLAGAGVPQNVDWSAALFQWM